jgi:phosphatidylinositol alpha 1,6-mannosyltransferase
MLLDLEAHPSIGDLELWAPDGVHLRTHGHRLLAYRAAEVLGVPDAEALGELDAALHADEEEPPSNIGGLAWARMHGLPWALRRVAGRTAGDGLTAKHDEYIQLRPRRGARRSTSA